VVVKQKGEDAIDVVSEKRTRLIQPTSVFFLENLGFYFVDKS